MKVARWTLGGLGDLFVTAGVLLLLFVGWQLWWTDVTANRVQDGTVHSLLRDFASGPRASAQANETPDAVPFGQAFAIVRIPRFGADYARPVLEGTTRDILMDGVGHYTGTARPARSATSPSPATARPTGGPSTTSTCCARGT